MDQKQFQEILKKYLRSQATPEEERIIDSWYADMGKKTGSAIHKNEYPVLENKYWSGINARIEQSQKEGTHRSIRPWYAVGAAASVLLALFSYLSIGNYFPVAENLMAGNEQPDSKWKCIANKDDTPQLITLPDESKVTLQSKSRLRYSASYNKNERAVYLDGEAFFEVTRNEGKPFYVYTRKVTTKVLGTSFTVKAFKKEKDVMVAVKTGKVSVYTNGEMQDKGINENEVILTPNQKIVYDKAGEKLSRMIVESPQAILPLEEVKKMRFEAAPVAEIFTAIEKVYGVDLVFDEGKFSGCNLTSVISDGDLYNRLDIICKAIGATYSIHENQIVISGHGCHNP